MEHGKHFDNARGRGTDAPLTVSAEGASGWQASFGDRIVEGDSFAALAALVRGLGSAADGEIRT